MAPGSPRSIFKLTNVKAGGEPGFQLTVFIWEQKV